MFDQSAKQYVVFRLASRAGVCEAQSRIESEKRTGRRTRSMICIRSEAMPRTLHRRPPELQCSRHREIGWIVKGSRVELPCSIQHLRCYLCCACRLATSVPTIDVVMTSQSVLVRFVSLREGGLKRSRLELFAMYRTRAAGRSVVCHKMTARVVPRHQGT